VPPVGIEPATPALGSYSGGGSSPAEMPQIRSWQGVPVVACGRWWTPFDGASRDEDGTGTLIDDLLDGEHGSPVSGGR
jgi:hypothetical protein